MARSVKGLGVNLLENIVYKHLFSVSRHSSFHENRTDILRLQNQSSSVNKSSCLCASTRHGLHGASSVTRTPYLLHRDNRTSPQASSSDRPHDNSSKHCNISPLVCCSQPSNSSTLVQETSTEQCRKHQENPSSRLHHRYQTPPLIFPTTTTTTRGGVVANATATSSILASQTSQFQYHQHQLLHKQHYHHCSHAQYHHQQINNNKHHQQQRGNASYSGSGTGLRGGALGVRVVPSRAVGDAAPHLQTAVAQASGVAPHQQGHIASHPQGQDAGGVPVAPDEAPSPHRLAEQDLNNLFVDIRKNLKCNVPELEEIACYYFDGQGKVIRPLITVLMARAVNQHLSNHHRLLSSQLEIAKVTEMIHTASLLHDDVLDMADTRRGKPSVTQRFGQKKSVMAGDYILAMASSMLARLDSPQVTIVLAQVLTDLVQGEFMQLGSKEDENERFSHYLAKSFKKTASLIAYSCQAVAILGGADDQVQQVCFQYGRNVGIAFQLVDDFLDFVSSSTVIGKPTSVDLKLGVATAPVLFASDKFPELNPMILRRFAEPGDVAFALDCVHRSDGLQQTQLLARQHCLQAIRVLETLCHSQEKDALIAITDKVINRIR